MSRLPEILISLACLGLTSLLVVRFLAVGRTVDQILRTIQAPPAPVAGAGPASRDLDETQDLSDVLDLFAPTAPVVVPIIGGRIAWSAREIDSVVRDAVARERTWIDISQVDAGLYGQLLDEAHTAAIGVPEADRDEFVERYMTRHLHRIQIDREG